MKINTKFFGEIEVDDEKIITFEAGIMGFEALKDYAIIYNSETDPGKDIMWLQSVEDATIAFPVIDPLKVCAGYDPIVDENTLSGLGEYEADELYVVTLMTVPQDCTKVTVNLKAPVIINTASKKAIQVIVENQEYEVRYNVYEAVQKLKNKAGGQ